jgi:hypothetical protein
MQQNIMTDEDVEIRYIHYTFFLIGLLPLCILVPICGPDATFGRPAVDG